MSDSTIRGPALSESEFGPLTLPSFFREVCRRNGDREAMVFKDARYTYQQLWNESVALSRALIARGVTKDVRVGLLATNRPEWVIAAFAISMAGGTCVALSTFAKRDELEYLLRIGDVALLIAERSILERDFIAELIQICPELATSTGTTYSTRLPFLRRVISIDDAPAPRGAFESWRDVVQGELKAPAALLEAMDKEIAPTDRAMVFFSSGSTAKPKAILHTHRAAAIQCWRWSRIVAIDSNVRTWTANGFFWSGNFTQAVGSTLSAGGCLVLQRFFDPGEALKLMQTERVTYPVAWPHQWARLAEHPLYNEVNLSSLRYVGETSPLRTHPTVHADWNEPMACYGNTETLTLSTAHYSGTPREISDGNHGLPLHGMIVRIVDPLTGKVLGRNQNGEIAVKGPTMMLGYLRVPPEETFDEEGFFRTGDGGSVDDQGRLHWQGRLNDIIKTGGANVSPLEIDAVLAECPGVKIGATVGVPHDKLGEMVVACVVPDPGATVDEGAVRSYLSQRLSSYKVPRRVLFIQESDLSLTSSNKVKTAPLRELAARHLAEQ